MVYHVLPGWEMPTQNSGQLRQETSLTYSEKMCGDDQHKPAAGPFDLHLGPLHYRFIAEDAWGAGHLQAMAAHLRSSNSQSAPDRIVLIAQEPLFEACSNWQHEQTPLGTVSCRSDEPAAAWTAMASAEQPAFRYQLPWSLIWRHRTRWPSHSGWPRAALSSPFRRRQKHHPCIGASGLDGALRRCRPRVADSRWLAGQSAPQLDDDDRTGNTRQRNMPLRSRGVPHGRRTGGHRQGTDHQPDQAPRDRCGVMAVPGA